MGNVPPCLTVPCQAVPCLAVPCTAGSEKRPTELIDTHVVFPSRKFEPRPKDCNTNLNQGVGTCRPGFTSKPPSELNACIADSDCIPSSAGPCAGGYCQPGYTNFRTGTLHCVVDADCQETSKPCDPSFEKGLEDLTVEAAPGNTQNFQQHLETLGAERCLALGAQKQCTRIFVSTVNPVDGSKAQAIYRCPAR